MIYIFIWYALGIIGVCVTSHVECKQLLRKAEEDDLRFKLEPTTFLQYLALSILGPIAFFAGAHLLLEELRK